MTGQLVGTMDNLLLEAARVINIFDKDNDNNNVSIRECYGENVVDNSLPKRTLHEVQWGRRRALEKGVDLQALIYNLPYTIVKNGRVAQTAFTERDLNFRHIFLVPDDTPMRIMNDTKVHRSGLVELVKAGSITHNTFEKWDLAMASMTVGERVAASIIHEYGHILTFDAIDEAGIEEYIDLYDWLDAYGCLDNCSKRVLMFATQHPLRKINIVLEQLAEDFRISYDISSEQDVCSLPSAASYKQDIVSPSHSFEGVEIMEEVLKPGEKKQRNNQVSKNNLDRVLPFGEANRVIIAEQFSHGVITPLQDDVKKHDREILRDMLNQ